MKIFLDFDHTLFDTNRFFHSDFKNKLLPFFNAMDKADDPWVSSYKNIRLSGYSIEKHIQEVNRLYNVEIPLSKITEIIKNHFSNLEGYLFRDVVQFLNKSKSTGAELFILSFGDPAWQKYKVNSTGIGSYFDKMYFSEADNEKTKLITKECGNSNDKIIFVDNNPSELDLVKDLMPSAQTYYMNRVLNSNIVIPDIELIGARIYKNIPHRHKHIFCTTLDEIGL